MKKTTVFTLAAVCGAFALALPDWKQPLNAAYPNVQYTWTGAEVTQALAVGRCNPLRIWTPRGVSPTRNDIALYDNGSYVQFRYPTGGGAPVATMTGEWTKVATSRGATYYLSINSASLLNLFGELQTAGLANCQTRFTGMSTLNLLPATTRIVKNQIITRVVRGTTVVAGDLGMVGFQQNNATGLGAFKLQVKLTKGTWTGL